MISTPANAVWMHHMRHDLFLGQCMTSTLHLRRDTREPACTLLSSYVSPIRDQQPQANITCCWQNVLEQRNEKLPAANGGVRNSQCQPQREALCFQLHEF